MNIDPNRSVNILLIEDNESDRLLMKKMLLKHKKPDFNLADADSLAKGLSLISEQKVDIIILDLYLPDSKGLDTLNKIKTNAPDLPVVVLTGNDDGDLAEKTIRLGAQDYLVKGQISAHLLERSLRYAIERKKSEETLRKANSELESKIKTQTQSLQNAIMELNHEINERKRAEKSLLEAHDELENKIKERTHELERINEQLNIQLEERTIISEALHENEQQFRALVSSIPGAVYRFRIDSKWTLEYISDAIEEITGYPPSVFIHNRVRPYRSLIHPEDQGKVEKAIAGGLEPLKSFQVEYRIIDANKRIRWFSEKGQAIFDEWGQPLWLDGAIFDESDRKFAEEALRRANLQLKHLATIDELTQIANRRQFDEWLTSEWNRMKRKKTPLSLIMCDIDFFKRYNDNYGHQSGDKCLCAVAQAIRSVVKRSSDFPARYGGEEFAVILPYINSTEAMKIAKRIQKNVIQLNIPHDHSPIAGVVTLSLGISSLIPTSGYKPADLIKAADKALYEAKDKGRNQVIMSSEFCVPANDRIG